MPAINAGAIIEVALSYSANGQRCINLYHWRTTNNIPDQSLDAIYAEWENRLFLDVGGIRLQDSHRAVTSIQVVYESYRLQFVQPVRYRAKVVQFVNVLGMLAGDCEAQNLQTTILKRADVGNRHGLGAVRIGGMPTGSFDQGLVTQAHQTLLQNHALDLSAALATASGWLAIPVIYQRPRPNVGFSSQQVIGTQVKAEVRTLRTRTVGRGE